MNRSFTSNDGRIVARVILLAHRFGCDYSALSVTHADGLYSVSITLAGPPVQLQRLDAQITKLLSVEAITALPL